MAIGATFSGFIKLANDYSSTDAGNLANLYAGLCYANLISGTRLLSILIATHQATMQW